VKDSTRKLIHVHGCRFDRPLHNDACFVYHHADISLAPAQEIDPKKNFPLGLDRTG
jgi:hypothetical protein